MNGRVAAQEAVFPLADLIRLAYAERMGTSEEQATSTEATSEEQATSTASDLDPAVLGEQLRDVLFISCLPAGVSRRIDSGRAA